MNRRKFGGPPRVTMATGRLATERAVSQSRDDMKTLFLKHPVLVWFSLLIVSTGLVLFDIARKREGTAIPFSRNPTFAELMGGARSLATVLPVATLALLVFALGSCATVWALARR